MRKLKLTVEYDGTGYAGFQIQPNGPTIQGELESALTRLTGETIRIRSASRTDSGVHALGHVVSIDTSSTIPTDRFARALTTRLPKDIAVVHADDATADFNPRHGAKSKLYRYRIASGPIRPVLDRHRTWHVKWSLDLAAMQTAASHFLGSHDFTSFANQECNREGANNVRTIYRSEVLAQNDRVIYEVEGRSFLYNMVRNLVGSLVDVGLGNLTPEDIPRILAARNRQKAGQGAPAHGLCLVWIRYE